jgi:cobalt-zinc-cadmium efflux system outer membrane protein
MTLPGNFRPTRNGAARVVLIASLAVPSFAPGLCAQSAGTAVSRVDAVSQALTNGPLVAVARADTMAAFAQLLTARAFQNPALSVEYTKSAPQYHFRVEQPIDLPGIRGLRINSAQSARMAAALQYAYARASVALDADTTYTRALAARARSNLSLRNAADADSLLKIAAARRSAGDASDLDVELATVFAGQAANSAVTDSLIYLSVLLDLQSVMGFTDPGVSIYPSDSLALPPPVPAASRAIPGIALPVQAAARMLESAQSALRVERRGIFSGISLAAGFETHDPSGGEKGFLPVLGVVVPLPVLNRNRGPIAQARADEMRASASLQLARVQSRTEIARAERELSIAMRRVVLDQSIVAAANRVAAMSLTAYREGASPLAASLEAQRSAREALMQYVDDIAAAWIATAELRVLTMTTTELPALR